MPFEIEWIDEQKTVILVSFEPGWTWREFIFETSFPKIEMMDSVEHPVYIVHLIPGTLTVPQMGWLRSYREEVGTPHHPNYAAAIFVSTNSIAKTLVRVAERILPSWKNRLLVVPSEEAALALVDELKAKRAIETRERPGAATSDVSSS